MKYKELYKNCKDAVRKEIQAVWCGIPKTTDQAAYKNKIQDLMDDIFAPANAMPIVESMADYEQTPLAPQDYEQFVTPNNGLPSRWGRPYQPYKHQVECWENLSKGKSIVVTTGTGSGKTECFMLPIVKDIIDNLPNSAGKVQAIFLYPLNALMEDQKLRLLKVLEGSDVKFAIYNGSCPEDEADIRDIIRKVINDNPGKNEYDIAQISAKRILGCSSDVKLKALKCWNDFDQIIQGLSHRKAEAEFPEEVYQALTNTFTNIIFTRKAIRQAGSHPEIILTNSSMIEYSLLRTSDISLYSDSAQALKWFVIDETHTYSGSGAIELAMQVRRVLNAFDIADSSLVRFATSSATVGGTTTTTDLKEFIKNLTGNEPVVITGAKNPLPGVNIPAIARLSNSQTGYLPLDTMIQEGNSIEEKLDILDRTIDSYNSSNNASKIKVKVHFFFRVLNRGLKVCLSDIDQGNNCFNLHLDTPVHRPAINSEPYLELARCTSCGEYIAIGQYSGKTGANYKFRAKQIYTDSLFSLDNIGNDESFETGVFAYVKRSTPLRDGSAFIAITGDEFKSHQPTSTYAVVINMQCNCPHCGKSLQTDTSIEEIGEVNRMQTFRLSAAQIDQMISPAILGQMRPIGGPTVPHQGQQYLTFVDSRKDAAKATLEQNLKVKQEYVYQLVYNELLHQRETNFKQISTLSSRVNAIRTEADTLRANGDLRGAYNKDGEALRIQDQIDNLENFTIPFKEIVDLLDEDSNIQLLFEQSIDDNDIIQETKDENAPDAEKQQVINKLKKCFVYGLAYELLAKRHLRGFSPETMGLFHSTYPIIDNATLDLPQSVIAFNTKVINSSDKIDVKDWKDLLTIALNQARSNESMFIKYDDPTGFKVDIHACRRFASGDSSRKSIRIKDDNTSTQATYSHIVYLLADLLPANGGTLSDTVRDNILLINDVLKDVNSTLIYLSLSEVGKITRKDSFNNTDNWEDERDDNGNNIFRLNVDNIAFRLFDEVAFCDVFGLDEPRPTPVLFKGRSPFFYFGDASKLKPVAKESWGSTYVDSFTDENALHSWAQTNRRQIWDTLWSNDGVFASRLDNIYLYDTAKDFFLQAEHTAQIDKSLSRQYQSLFQEHKINILACSTTMEMGVDLGDLELVLMNSVPPAPANYKQRAGRSGRGQDIYKSAAVTLCSSDSLGARTLRDPYGMIIGRAIMPPAINFDNNERIIQRHLNTYCFRRVLFDKWIPAHPGRNTLSFTLRDFYTNFNYETTRNGARAKTEYHKIKVAGSTNRFLPNTVNPLGCVTGTIYDTFLQELPMIPLQDCEFIFSVFSPVYNVNKQNMKDKVESMFQDTFNRAKEIALSIGETFEDYCKSKGLNPNNPNDLNTIDADKILSGVTRSLAKLLEKPLLEYLATNRFSPNANMPVDVLEFDVNYSSNSWIKNKKSNPSYQLREALSQYSPGNKVVLKNAVYTVGGLSIKGLHRNISDLDVLWHSDQGRISTTGQTQLLQGESWQPWQGHSDSQLMVLRPYAFLPESDKDQKSSSHSVGIVKSQLVGVNIWSTPSKGALIDSRSSHQAPESRILYYNDGYGYGFSYCRKCGRTVPEIMPFDHSRHISPSISQVINNKDGVINGTPSKYHLSLNLYGKICSSSNNQTDNRVKAGKATILRHAVIGDYLQTDFTEFRFFWQNGDELNDERFLNAMGILLCQAYSDYATIERRDLDFSITADKHLCIFDAYSGGAGNSDKLSNPALIDNLLKAALCLVTNANSSTDLFDKFTLRYEDQADFVMAVDWISAYMASTASVAKVAGAFPNDIVTTASRHDIEAHIQSLGPNGRIGIFSSTDFDSWTDSEPASLSTITHFLVVNNKQCDLCLIGDASYLPVNAKILLNKMGTYQLEQCSAFPVNGIYPLAIVDSTLYFTKDALFANLNEKWAQGVIYKVAFNSSVAVLPLTITFDPQKDVVFYLNNPRETKITSNKLYDIVKGQTNFIDRFIHAIPNTEGTISFTYEDQFLKSRLSVIIVIQFIRHMITEIKAAKPNIANVSINFWTEKDHNGSIETYTGNNIWWSLEESVREKISEDYLYDLCHSLERLHITAPWTYRLLPNGSQEHWRELKVSCQGCEIVISPNGGFANEWKFDRYPAAPTMAIDEDNPVNIDDEIPIFRGKNIKYDMQLSGSAI